MTTDAPPQDPPIRADFWAVVLPALQAALTAGSEFFERMHYPPRLKIPEYQEGTNGWPATVKDRLLSTGSGPLNWGELFTTSADDSGRRLSVAQVPEVQRALEICQALVRDDLEFRKGFSDYIRILPDELQRADEYIGISFLIFLGKLLNRAVACESTSDEDLLALYLELERGMFAPRLDGDVVVPILLMSFANTEPIQIVEGVFLEPISRAEQRSRAMDWMATDVPAYLAAAATHALVFRNLSFDNPHHRGDWLTRGRQSQFDRSEIDLLFQSLYMKTGTASGYAQILVRPRGWAMRWTHDLPPMFTEWSGRRYPESLDEARLFRELRPLSIEETTSVAELFARLIRAPGNVKLAARRAYRISFRDEVEDQIIDAAIGIEALVGKDRDELTHRMSQRAAVALRGEFPPQNIYSLVKQLYTQRSVIVHGGIPKKTEVSLNERNMPATAMGDFLLRALLKDYLAADEPWTPETLDAMILSGLERDGGYPESVPED